MTSWRWLKKFGPGWWLSEELFKGGTIKFTHCGNILEVCCFTVHTSDTYNFFLRFSIIIADLEHVYCSIRRLSLRAGQMNGLHNLCARRSSSDVKRSKSQFLLEGESNTRHEDVVVPVVSKAYVYLVPHFLSSF
jgi:hypothetical protein